REALRDLNLPVVLQSGHFTDVGLQRELNEDSVLALNLTQYYESVQTQIGLYIVSDGMGGEAAGQVDSRRKDRCPDSNRRIAIGCGERSRDGDDRDAQAGGDLG